MSNCNERGQASNSCWAAVQCKVQLLTTAPLEDLSRSDGGAPLSFRLRAKRADGHGFLGLRHFRLSSASDQLYLRNRGFFLAHDPVLVEEREWFCSRQFGLFERPCTLWTDPVQQTYILYNICSFIIYFIDARSNRAWGWQTKCMARGQEATLRFGYWKKNGTSFVCTV